MTITSSWELGLGAVRIHGNLWWPENNHWEMVEPSFRLRSLSCKTKDKRLPGVFRKQQVWCHKSSWIRSILSWRCWLKTKNTAQCCTMNKLKFNIFSYMFNLRGKSVVLVCWGWTYYEYIYIYTYTKWTSSGPNKCLGANPYIYMYIYISYYTILYICRILQYWGQNPQKYTLA